MTPPCIWLDAFALAALPRVDEELGRAGALVMRSFQRVPQPAIAARFGEREQAVVLSGRTLEELERRLELATVTLRVPVIAVTPPTVAPSAVPRRAGLVDVLPGGAAAKEAAARILLMSGMPVVTPAGTVRGPLVPREREPVAFSSADGQPAVERVDKPVVAVASSTGGLLVLAEFLRRLSPEVLGGVLVAQHMDAEFVPLFASWLAEASGWRVEVVGAARALEPGSVLVAEGGRDLYVDEQGRAACASPAGRFVPNADRLLTSVARAFGKRAVGVVLSGMGEDGARGAAEVMRGGGRLLAQAPGTAAVSSMPQAASRVTGARLVLPEELAAVIEAGAR